MKFQVVLAAIALCSVNTFAAPNCEKFGELNREEKRECAQAAPSAKIHSYSCALSNGREILKMAEVKAASRNEAILRVTLENAAVDGDLVVLKDNDPNTTQGAWVQAITGVTCISAKK